MKAETTSERVEVPGARPATLRLRLKAEDSYDFYRSSRKLGYWRFRLPPQIQAKLASWRGGQTGQRLEEVRTIVRAIHVLMLLEPKHDQNL